MNSFFAMDTALRDGQARSAADQAALVRSLRELGYEGPIGFQGYSIPGDSRQILDRTMQAWRRMSAP